MKQWNFSAGPSMLPTEVKKRIQLDLEAHSFSGMSVMEWPHRGEQFQSVLERAEHDLRTLLGLPNDWHILWLQGGARAQNAFIPLNFIGLNSHHCADYIVSGHWSETSFAEARRLGFDVSAHHAVSVHQDCFDTNPDVLVCDVREHASYVHLCWNETVNGLEYAIQPRLCDTSIPLVMDVSSNFLSRPIDFSTPACFYASAQKNAGIAGLTIVLVHESLLGATSSSCPDMFNYSEMVRVGKPLNTLPTFP
ncbi:MAG: aminotransferase class V-fold PLP-dependent enzyme, partial [Alcaligenaceae bacterium]|nr:aminotransferase class V-fold PLP-dependent enzyme [Alcaligenaceae bacterium]